MDMKARLRSALSSLEDRDLNTQGHYTVKLIIENLQTAQHAGIVVRELVSGAPGAVAPASLPLKIPQHSRITPCAAGLERCARSAANNRILLLSYLLVTQGHLSPVRAMPQAMPSLISYIKRQQHSTNLDDLATLGSRLGQALAIAMSDPSALPSTSRAAGSGGATSGASASRWADMDQLTDRRSIQPLSARDRAATSVALLDSVDRFIAGPAWVLNHILLPLLRVACR